MWSVIIVEVSYSLVKIAYQARFVNHPYQPVVEVTWVARRAPAAVRRGARRTTIRDILFDEQQSRRSQMSAAQRVTRPRTPAGASCPPRRSRSPPAFLCFEARNAARLTLTTGC